jgi:hypothetical protein
LDGFFVNAVRRILNTSTSNILFSKRQSLESGNFSGVIDDIAIYNRALSPSEITQLYNALHNITQLYTTLHILQNFKKILDKTIH